MNRFFQIFNFLGICTLAILCMAQWTANRNAHLRVNDLQAANQKQADTIADQIRTIQGDHADLDDFRHRLTQAKADLSDTQGKLAAMTAQRDQLIAQHDQLTAERDQLKASLNKWIAALKERDALIKQAGGEITQLAIQRNQAILKFNDLANKYNLLVKQLLH